MHYCAFLIALFAVATSARLAPKALHDIKSSSTFEQNLQEEHVLLEFYSTWCSPCRTIAEVLTKAASTYPEVVFMKIDVDELATIADRYGVSQLPTVVYLRKGNEVGRFVGGRQPKAVTEFINEGLKSQGNKRKSR